MKKIVTSYWREALIGILVIAMFISVKSCKENQSDLHVVQSKYDTAQNQITAYKLKSGEQVFQIKTLQVTKSQLTSSGILKDSELKKLKQQVGNLNGLVSYYKGGLTMDDTFGSGGTDTVIVEKVGKDTVRRKEKTFTWSNQWLKLKSVYDPVADTLTHRYLYRTEFTMTSYYKGKNFFHKGELVSDISFADPKIQIGSFQGVKVEEPPKHFWETRGFAIALGLAAGIAVSR